MFNTYMYYTKMYYFCKNEIIMENPFKFGKLVVKNQFIDRDEELLNLEQNIVSQQNTILISPRRWGKSSLVKNTASIVHKKNKNIKFCFIDLFSIRGEDEFYEVYATEVIKATSSKWEDWVSNGKEFFKRLIPRFQLGIDPNNDFSISFDWQELQKEGDEILDLPEKISLQKNIQVVVCIDEFQNISHFEEPLLMQKKMRAVWQQHQIATYCLYGSKRHMLSDLFENKSKPFYKFGETVFLKKIEQHHWKEFIVNQFAETKKEIGAELAIIIANRMENHPYFVQLYASKVWKLSNVKCDLEILNKAIEEMKMQYALMFQRELDNLTNKQLNFLIALVDGVEKFSSQKTLKNYNLGSQGNVKRIKTALENKEVIDLWGNTIEFIDPLFKIWFFEDYLRK